MSLARTSNNLRRSSGSALQRLPVAGAKFSALAPLSKLGIWRLILALVAVLACASALAASPMPVKFDDLRTDCMSAVLSGSPAALEELDMASTGAANGAISASVHVSGGKAIVPFVPKVPKNGVVCGNWAHLEKAHEFTLAWGTEQTKAEAWVNDLVTSFGFEDATNPAGPGIAATKCDGPEPWLWVDAQPAWQLHFRSGDGATRLPPEQAAFRFQAHRLSNEMCASNQALITEVN